MTISTLSGLYTGRVAPDYAKGRASAIDKQPVPGEVSVDRLGLTGDEQADPDNHGGPERALLHYCLDHYAWWQTEHPARATRFEPPGFGENLASRDMDEHSVHIGDVYRIGSVRVQVSQPRTPCWKLDVRFDIPGLARRVQETGRCGWFYRVLEPGTLTPGDTIERLERQPEGLSIAAAMAAIYRQPNHQHLQQLAHCEALAPNWREKARRKLRRAPDASSQQRLAGGPANR
ncbi:MOSC domain-containing protein [Thioalkalivibrio sp. AKL7]|uniref:MOSC domain-containing protein n=1 Tax=Thioalkalivibrio sp. AKL7 TaxID=1158155 RepID=UPI0003668DC6|nr:MOSC domain-containing protein [Thioalkalivibrio sp. AKL7]